MLLFSLIFFYSCASFTGVNNTQGLGITVLDINHHFVKGVKVELVEESGKRHRAKYNPDNQSYLFSETFTRGTLRLSHRKFLSTEYQLTAILDHKVRQSIKLFLQTDQQKSYTIAGIRYPYVPQPHLIALMADQFKGEQAERYLEEARNTLLELGLVRGDFQRDRKDKHGNQRVLIGTFLAELYQLPENENTALQQQISQALRSTENKVINGLLLGERFLLKRKIKVKVIQPDDHSKAIQAFDELKGEVELLDLENGTFELYFSTFSTEEILVAIEALNETNLFYPVQPMLVELFKAD